MDSSRDATLLHRIDVGVGVCLLSGLRKGLQEISLLVRIELKDIVCFQKGMCTGGYEYSRPASQPSLKTTGPSSIPIGWGRYTLP